MQRLKLALEQSADAIIASVDGFGVGYREALHTARELIVCGAEQEMIMVGHKAVGNDGAAWSIGRRVRGPGVGVLLA